MALHTACKRFCTLLAFLLLFAAPALRADTQWHWTYTSNAFTGNGTLSTTSTSDGNLIDAFSGTWNGATITGIAPQNGYGDNDNLLSSTQPQLTDNGIAFFIGTDVWNIFFDGAPGAPAYLAFDTSNSDNGLGVFSANPSALTLAQTPEPSSILLVGTALMALAGFAWYRKQDIAAMTA